MIKVPMLKVFVNNQQEATLAQQMIKKIKSKIVKKIKQNPLRTPKTNKNLICSFPL